MVVTGIHYAEGGPLCSLDETDKKTIPLALLLSSHLLPRPCTILAYSITMATQTDTYQAAQNNTNLTGGHADANSHGTREKDYGNGTHAWSHNVNIEKTDSHRQDYHLDNGMDAGAALKRIQTSGSLSISPELFEKIYLSPQNRVAGELRKTFANPTPM